MKYLTILFITISTSDLMAEGIKVSQQAPNIQHATASGQELNLTNYKGKTILLSFFRFAGCPVCNYRMHQLMENYDALAAQNIEVIAVFESSNQVLNKYMTDYEIPFPMIGDPQRLLYKAYGVEKSTRGIFRTLSNKEAKKHMKQGEALFNKGTYKKDGSMKQMQADFIIDAQGRIARMHYASFIGDHIPLEEVLKAGSSTDKASIKTTIAHFAKAGDEQDVEALDKLLDHNYRIVMNQLFGSTQVVVMSREAYLDKIKAKEFGGDQRTVSIEHITINGNTASAKVRLEGSKMTFVSLLDFVKDASGNWLLVQDLPVIVK